MPISTLVAARLSTPRALLALALLCGLYIMLMGSQEPWWHDYGPEAWPADERLIKGDFRGFLEASPGYLGWMLLKAPLAYAAGAFGGADQAVYRAGAILPLLALAILAAHLAGEASRRVESRYGTWLVLGLVGASPIAYQAYFFGHPEDVLAAALCVGGLLAALSGRPVAAGAMLGVAMLAKQWAVLAVLPALLTLPRGRVQLVVVAGAILGLVHGAVFLFTPETAVRLNKASTTSAYYFHRESVWWFFGDPATAEFKKAMHGTRMTPEWLAPWPKPLIVLSALPLSALWRRRRAGGAPVTDALLLLSLLLLLRCVLDPWNLIYYHLPLVLSLTAWEVIGCRRLPVLALAVTGLAWLNFEMWQPSDPNWLFFLYFAWVLPLALYIVRKLFARPERAPAIAAPAPSFTPVTA